MTMACPLRVSDSRTDMQGARALRSYVPLAEVTLAYSIRLGKHQGPNGEAECLGGLEVDYQFETIRSLHRQVGGLRALENPPYIDAGLVKSPPRVAAVAHQAAVQGVHAKRIDRRNHMMCRQRQDFIAISH